MQLTDKYILVTGANRGIGLAFAKAVAKEKAHVLVAVRNPEPLLEQELKVLGAASVKILKADLATRQGVEELIIQLSNQKIDILFNNAGLLTGGLLEEQPLDDIYKMFQVNVNALVHLTHALLPRMIQQGSGKIINHSSVSAVMHLPCASTYAAAKAAVWAFTDCLQQELKGTGVSTLCLFTPGVKTQMFDEIDKLYSKNLESPKNSISPDAYVMQVIESVKNNAIYHEPKGATGLAFMVATHFKSVFNWAAQKKFHR